MTLLEHLLQLKLELVAATDVDVVTRIYQECRAAERELMQVTDLAGDMAEKLTRSTVPEAWQPYVVVGGKR